MSAILRQNAARFRAGVGGAQLRGGGDGRWMPGFGPAVPVKRRARYSHDPAAELMPAAEFLGHEPDYNAILEHNTDSPFNPARRKILGRLMGMFAMDYQGARSQERAFLRRLLDARNAREGYVANRALHLCGIPHAIRRTLALGVAESRFETGPLDGFLGAVQSRIAATTFSLLGPVGRETLWRLLVDASHDEKSQLIDGSDPVIERALILKALGSRRDRLGPWSAQGDRALDEIAQFAGMIRGKSREVLAARTTLMPGDEKRIAKGLNNVHGAQRAIFLARGECDPIFSWHEHAASDDTGVHKKPSEIASYIVLPELDRNLLVDRPRLHQALAEARACHGHGCPDKTPMNLAQVEALTDYFVGRDIASTRLTYKDEALEIFAEQGFDVVRPEAIEAIRSDARGVYKFDAAVGLGLLLSRFTGAMYVRRILSDQMTARADPAGQFLEALTKGLAVPFLVRAPKSDPRPWAAVFAREETGENVLDVHDPVEDELVVLRAKALTEAMLPFEEFGERARIDAYLAPAALDLLAPPFGLAFPELGIRDVL